MLFARKVTQILLEEAIDDACHDQEPISVLVGPTRYNKRHRALIDHIVLGVKVGEARNREKVVAFHRDQAEPICPRVFLSDIILIEQGEGAEKKILCALADREHQVHQVFHQGIRGEIT
ncbi:hypothetical protein HN670_02545 [bacterium]|nr:hypothetical protein [bacterium]